MEILHFAWNKKFIATIILLLMSGFISSCSNNTASTQDALEDQNIPLVQEVSASGEVVPIRSVTLSYPSGAEAIELKVAKGDEVSEDDVLVTSNDSRFHTSLLQARANLERAQFAYDQIKEAPSDTALKSAEAAYKNAKANLTRQEDLGADESVIDAAEADLDAALANINAIIAGSSSQEVKAAAYDLEAVQLSLEQAQAASTIRAPFSGTIVETFADSGEAIGALQPLLTLADLSSFEVVTTDLSEVDVTRLREGQTANIVFDAISDRTFQGTIEKIADKSSGVSSVYYPVTLTLDEVPKELRWGMTAFIIFPVD